MCILYWPAGIQPHNVFDRLSSEWYHLYLTQQLIFPGRRGGVYVTHINGLIGFWKFPFYSV